MASIGHVAIGLAAGRYYAGTDPQVRMPRAMLAFTVLSLLPDLDVIAFRLGIPYHHPFGHRGASHALLVAVVGGLLCAAVAARDGHRFKTVAWLSAAVLASHGILDAFTDGGLGAALWWPFSDARVFWPWQPLPVAPIGRGMISARGVRVLLEEGAYFLPVLLYALWPRRRR